MGARADYKWALLCGALVTAAGFLGLYGLLLPGFTVTFFVLGVGGNFFHATTWEEARFSVVLAAVNCILYALIIFLPLRIRRHLRSGRQGGTHA